MAAKQKKTWLDQSQQTLQLMFFEDLQDKKKIQALQNLALAKRYRQINLVKIVAEDYKHGFLEMEERNFLDFVLKRHALDYLSWSHRTRWLKQEIASIRAKFRYKEATKKKTQPNVVQLPLFPDIDKISNIMPAVANRSGSFIPGSAKRSSFRKWVGLN